jgi:2-polyprenyl-6-methoxyphenol hydroxylase-like FAD-dependent oxidoreductase
LAAGRVPSSKDLPVLIETAVDLDLLDVPSGRVDLSTLSMEGSARPKTEARNGILIIGAGLAGLTLALALARRGIPSTVIEKQETITPSKWTILLYPQGMKIFDDLGVLSDVTAQALKLKAPRVETMQGEVLAELETGMLFEQRLNFSLGMGPSEIRQVLMNRAASQGVEVLEGVRYRGLIRDTDGTGKIIGAQVDKDGSEFVISSQILIGADGYKSKVREDFGVSTDVKQHETLVGIYVECRHDEDRFRMVLGDGYYVVVYPWTKNRLSLGFGERGLSELKLSQEGGADYVEKKILDALPSLSEAVKAGKARFIEDSAIVISPKEVQTSYWAFDGGVLIGDAAHSLHPGTGQGAQQAFVDAITLAPIIEDCRKNGRFSRTELMKFERQRMPLIRLAESVSSRALGMETARGRFGLRLRNRYFRKTNELLKHKWFQEILAGLRVPTTAEKVRVVLSLFS